MKLFSKIYQTPIYKVYRREISRFLDSRVLPFTTLIAPVLAFLIIVSVFSSGIIRDLPVIVVDNDQTMLSRALCRAIDASPAARVVKVESLNQARQLMDKGKSDAIVLIGKNMEQSVMKGDAPDVSVFINNTNLVKGGVLKSGIYKSIETVSAGIKVQTLMKKGANQQQALEKARPIKTDTHLLFNPFTNYSYFLVVALLALMVNIFTLLVSVYAIGIELKEGSAENWLSTANNNIYYALAGKMLPYTFLFMANVMVMNILLFHYLGTPIHGSLFVIIVSEILLVIVYQVVAVVFIALTSNMRLSLSLGSAYTMMALTFSGLTFPVIAMPLVARLFSLVFPYTFWLKIFMSQTLRGEPLIETAIPLLALVAFILSGFFAMKKLKRQLENEKYWGKS
jgi:ABC-2 type transport system permease protein